MTASEPSEAPVRVGGLNRSAVGNFDSGPVSKPEIEDLFMLKNEAFRLAFRQEQSHGPIDSKHRGIASTHDRRYADAQALAQDTGQLYSRCTAVCEVSWPFTRHRHS